MQKEVGLASVSRRGQRVMPKYSPQSEGRLSTCHADLQKVFRKVLETFDHTIECGERSQEEQHKAFLEHRSEIDWPDPSLPGPGKHNRKPSDAVDAMPFPYSWPDIEGKGGQDVQKKALLACGIFIGYVIKTAEEMFAAGEISAMIDSGVDWDHDYNVKEHSFIDVPHFQRRV